MESAETCTVILDSCFTDKGIAAFTLTVSIWISTSVVGYFLYHFLNWRLTKFKTMESLTRDPRSWITIALLAYFGIFIIQYVWNNGVPDTIFKLGTIFFLGLPVIWYEVLLKPNLLMNATLLAFVTTYSLYLISFFNDGKVHASEVYEFPDIVMAMFVSLTSALFRIGLPFIIFYFDLHQLTLFAIMAASWLIIVANMYAESVYKLKYNREFSYGRTKVRPKMSKGLTYAIKYAATTQRRKVEASFWFFIVGMFGLFQLSVWILEGAH